jgi:P pilus assembly chaperone PapD
MEIVFRPREADSRVGIITLTNEGAKPVEAQLRLEDWDRAEDGTNHWYPLGTLAGSCGPLLQLFPASVFLDAGASQTIRLVVDSTAAPLAECWSAAVVETVQPRIVRGRSVSYLIRTAVKLYVMPQDLPAEGEVVEMGVRPTLAARADSLDLVFRNAGARHLIAGGTVELRRGDNSVAAKVELPSLYALPGARSRTRVALPHLAPGRYVVLAILDYGGDQLAAAQIEYEVP